MKGILCSTNDMKPSTEAVAQQARGRYDSQLLVAMEADVQLIDSEIKSVKRWHFYFSMSIYVTIHICIFLLLLFLYIFFLIIPEFLLFFFFF